jgi:hypothetical protein
MTVQAPGGVTQNRLKSRGQQKVAPGTPGSGLGIRLTTLSQKMWHVDPLLGNDPEVSNYTTAVAR